MSCSKGAVPRICEQCETAFKAKPYLIREGHGRYCCQRCSGEAAQIPPELRFWFAVDMSGGEDACWPWIAGRGRLGYGQLYVNGRNIPASRFSYALHHGPIPEGMIVLHSCDNPPCCNPAHLSLGTYADNSADMVAKSRQAIGERHGSRTHPGAVKKAIPRREKHHSAKLTQQSAAEIIHLYRQGGITMQRLADQYGVHIMTVCNVIHGRTWGAATASPLEA